ncbi:MAG: tripartite tricarboxylate transporter permease [Candidatus Thermoplasmatota archaeon]|nr:tripartite tricarboxylate transporter permease [Candidatus Thermoplasmatota archaeon]
MNEIILIMIFALLGAFFGCATGLVPGMHVNTIALILLSLTPMLQFLPGIIICVIIVSTCIAHSFINLIPGTFLGAPDENALSVLPAHKMLLEGNGYQAIFLSAVGSFGAIVFGFIFVFPFRFIFGNPINLYALLKNSMVFILILISAFLIYSENRRMKYKKGIGVENIKIRKREGKDNIDGLKIGEKCIVHGMIVRSGRKYFLEEKRKKTLVECKDSLAPFDGATVTVYGKIKRTEDVFSRTFGVMTAGAVFILSGIFGMIIFDLSVSSPVHLPSSPLFPAFTGLFGVSILLLSLTNTPEIPEQRINEPVVNRKESLKSIFTGSLAGSVLGFLPGITSGHATVLSMLGRKTRKKEQVVLTLSAVNTSYAFFCLAALFIIMRPRNGTMIAVDEMINIEEWSGLMPVSLTYLMIAVIVASAVSYFMTIHLGKCFAKIFTKINYKKLVVSIVVFITITVFLFTGFIGLLILITGIGVGLMPPCFGVRRSHAMGVLLLPVIIGMLG